MHKHKNNLIKLFLFVTLFFTANFALAVDYTQFDYGQTSTGAGSSSDFTDATYNTAGVKFEPTTTDAFDTFLICLDSISANGLNGTYNLKFYQRAGSGNTLAGATLLGTSIEDNTTMTTGGACGSGTNYIFTFASLQNYTSGNYYTFLLDAGTATDGGVAWRLNSADTLANIGWYNAGKTSFNQNGGASISLGVGAPPTDCEDGIMNGDETGIDIGGSCAEVHLNNPVDSSTTSNFINWSVSYSGIDIPDGQHQISVHWSEDSTLLTTCENDPFGSTFTGSFVPSVGYSTCSNSNPKVFYDTSPISFSAGIYSYTGTILKSQTLVDGKTYYVQVFVQDDSGFNTVASPVTSFTISGGISNVNGTGTISNTTGDGSITGTGTHFLNVLKIGDTITVGGQSCVVQSIASDTELECTPLTSSHTNSAWTYAGKISLESEFETCSTFDIFCYLKNALKWFFLISPSTLENFSTLSLADRKPFSYIADVPNIWNDLFDMSASESVDIGVDLGGTFGSITLIDDTTASTIPFYGFFYSCIGALLYLATAFHLYKKVITIHDSNHTTT